MKLKDDHEWETMEVFKLWSLRGQEEKSDDVKRMEKA
jgi:hypothetical protein